jgi:hypothetical protein
MAGYWTPMLAGYSKPIDTEITKLRADGEMLHKQGKHAVSEAALGQAESIFAIKKL